MCFVSYQNQKSDTDRKFVRGCHFITCVDAHRKQDAERRVHPHRETSFPPPLRCLTCYEALLAPTTMDRSSISIAFPCRECHEIEPTTCDLLRLFHLAQLSITAVCFFLLLSGLQWYWIYRSLFIPFLTNILCLQVLAITNKDVMTNFIKVSMWTGVCIHLG